MAFFVVERHAGDGSLRVVLPGTFPTREALLDALTNAIASGTAAVEGDLFVADLDSALPVLVVPSPRSAAGTESPAEMSAEDATAVFASWPAVTGVADVSGLEEPREGVAADADESLADALKRAASSLELEGIVAPESIDAAPVGEVIEPLGARGAESPTSSEAVGEPPAAGATSWPWANVDAYTPSADADGEEPGLPTEPPSDAEASADLAIAEIEEPESPAEGGLAFTPPETIESPYDEPAAEASAIIAGAPAEGEDAFLPSPVIMGDYGAEPGEPEVSLEYVTIPPAEDDASREDGESSDVKEPASEDGNADSDTTSPETAGTEDAEGEGEAGYGASEDLDLSAYTCNDCVYSNTCPKVGSASPSDCGSFQWKAG